MRGAAPAPEVAPGAPRPGRRRGARLLVPVGLALLTALAYVNAAHRALVFDDKQLISQGRRFGGIETIPRLFTENARAVADQRSRLYRPLAMATLALDRTVYGGHARGYHVTSIAWHVACTLVLFGLLTAVGLGRAPAFVAALVFGVHPIHTEAVDVAFNRSEILATVGVLAGLWWLWRLWRSRRVLALAGASVIYFLALLCRESAVTLPVLAALLLAVGRPADRARSLAHLAWLAVLLVPLAAYLALRQGALGEPVGGVGASFAAAVGDSAAAGDHWALVAVTLRDYLRMLVWPWPLRATCADYVVRAVGAAVVLHGCLVTLAITLVRRARWVSLAIAFVYVALLPSTRLFADPAVLAERFVYLPSAGAACALAAGLAALERRAGRRSVALVGVGLSLALAPLTLLRNLDWRSAHTLWEAEYAVTQNDWQVLLNLSEAYARHGRNREVLALCARGLALQPQQPGFYLNRAVALLNQDRFAEAEIALQDALRVGGGSWVYRAELARFYLMTDRQAAAAVEYERAAADAPDPADRHALRGELFLCQGDAVGAEAEFAAALALEPRLLVARHGLARARWHRRSAAASQPGAPDGPAAAASQPGASGGPATAPSHGAPWRP